jgi:hypothetical protein
MCKAINMDEIRIRGKFLRIQDIEDPRIEVVCSKWYYSFEIEEPIRIFIGVH